MRLPIVVLIVVITYCSVLVAPAWSQSSSAEAQQGTYSGAGMGAASAVATILYFPFKAAFAIGGGIVGGLAYVFSGLSEPTAKSIWSPAFSETMPSFLSILVVIVQSVFSVWLPKMRELRSRLPRRTSLRIEL